jgi:hypothetical protein
LFAGCTKRTPGPRAVRYDCAGFTALAVEAAPGRRTNLDGDLSELVSGIVQGFSPMRAKLGATIRVEKNVRQISGREVHGAKITVSPPAKPGMYYALGYALVVRERAVACTAHTSEGMQRCGPVTNLLLDGRTSP